MKIICERFTLQIKENIKKLYFKYEGNLINEDLKFEEQINETDRELCCMNIIVEEKMIEINQNKKSEEIKDILKEKIKNEKYSIINDNYIVAEININEEDINKDIRIINSWEEFKKTNEYNDFKDKGNEKELKEKCQIIINNNKIPFNYYHKFSKAGKYEIKYIFKDNLNRADYMFCRCNSLTNINLSNFNTENVINMSSMFYGCNSLTNINLSNFNTLNVNDMSLMFCGCYSLKKIKLSYFNTQNVSNMSYMFCGCNSLADIIISNFKTQNINNMSYMICGCYSITKINLSNFYTQNVRDMNYMFNECKSLRNIN